MQSPIVKSNFLFLFKLLYSKFFHRSCGKMSWTFSFVTQRDSFLFLFDRFRRYKILDFLVIFLGEGLVVIGVILSQLKSAVICILLGSFWKGINMMFGAEKSFESGDIVVGVLMRKLELVDVSQPRKVLFICILILLKLSHSLKETFIWLVYFHD